MSLEQICKNVLARSLELIKYSTNIAPESDYKNLLMHLVRKKNSEITRNNLFLWRYDSQSTEEKINSGYFFFEIKPNSISREKPSTPMLWSRDMLFTHLDELRNRTYKRYHKDGPNYTDLERVEANALNACRYQTGNCGEFTSVIMVLLLESKPLEKPLYIHRLTLNPGDHGFIVLSEKQNIDPTNPNTWGDNAWIIDGLCKETYHVKTELEKWEKNPNSCTASWIKILDGETNINQLKIEHIMDPFILGSGHSKNWRDKQKGLLSNFNHADYVKDKPHVTFKM